MVSDFMNQEQDNEIWGKLLMFLGKESEEHYPHDQKEKIAEMAKLCGQREVEFLIKRVIDGIQAERKIRAYNEATQNLKIHFDELGNSKA